MCKGYEIEKFQNGYTVFFEGDEIYFDTEEEAKEFIDSWSGNLLTVYRKVFAMKRLCPVCGQEYTEYPAISRLDNKTEICPLCGIDEALADWIQNCESEEEDVTDNF